MDKGSKGAELHSTNLLDMHLSDKLPLLYLHWQSLHHPLLPGANLYITKKDTIKRGKIELKHGGVFLTTAHRCNYMLFFISVK